MLLQFANTICTHATFRVGTYELKRPSTSLASVYQPRSPYWYRLLMLLMLLHRWWRWQCQISKAYCSISIIYTALSLSTPLALVYQPRSPYWYRLLMLLMLLRRWRQCQISIAYYSISSIFTGLNWLLLLLLLHMFTVNCLKCASRFAGLIDLLANAHIFLQLLWGPLFILNVSLPVYL